MAAVGHDGNQVALRLLTRPGDEVVTGLEAHAGSPAFSTARGCGTRRQPADAARPNWPRLSTSSRWPFPRVWARPAARCWPAEDHHHARALAETLAASPALRLDLATVQTNIVVFHLREDAPDGATLVAMARERGVLLNAFASRTARAVTHLDVSAAQVARAGQLLRELLGRARTRGPGRACVACARHGHDFAREGRVCA